MKKILLFFAAAFALFACDPEQEDISNGGNISVDELKAKTSVYLDKSATTGQDGNVLTCTTSAPVTAKWTIDGKDFLGNYAWKKMKLGAHSVVLTALCADGTELTVDYPINCQEITNPLEKHYIYGPISADVPDLVAGNWSTMRFSDTEGVWPTISDAIYKDKKTLLFEVKDVDGDDVQMKVMNGWWSNTYYDFGVITPKKNELMEIPLTETIYNECAKEQQGRDLTLLIINGSVTFGAVYYEE